MKCVMMISVFGNLKETQSYPMGTNKRSDILRVLYTVWIHTCHSQYRHVSKWCVVVPLLLRFCFKSTCCYFTLCHSTRVMQGILNVDLLNLIDHNFVFCTFSRVLITVVVNSQCEHIIFENKKENTVAVNCSTRGVCWMWWLVCEEK